KTNRVARLYLQLIEELQRQRMNGAPLPEYLPAWLDDFRNYFEDAQGGMKLRASRDELREATNLANEIRTRYLTPRPKARSVGQRFVPGSSANNSEPSAPADRGGMTSLLGS